MPERSSSNDSSSARSTARPQISHINLDNSLIAWDPTRPGGRGSASTVAANRRKIRAQASRSSASQRKATIAAKEQRQPQQTETPPLTPSAGREEPLLQAHRLHAALGRSRADAAGPSRVDFQEFVSVIDKLQSQQNWLQRALRETTLAQTQIRGDMRDAFTISPALFQATLFISGTFSNSCGLSYEHVKLGLGMAFMRGASLDAVRNAITEAEGEHWVSLAIALLAGWELRFGDRESYGIHMGAYRQILGSPIGLDENSIAMMRDFAFETLREQLNDLTISAPLRSVQPSKVWGIPTGLNVFSPALAPEVKSLLSITRDTYWFDPRPPENLFFIRNLGLKTMTWTPHHTESVEPSDTFEGHWDEAELNALLHLRAADLIVVALWSHVCHTMHSAKSYLDIMGAANVHAHSCIHLRTDSLIGTKYQYAAVWARIILSSIAPNHERDLPLIRGWLAAININTWEGVLDFMKAHMLLDVFAPQIRSLYDALAQDLVDC